MWIPSTLFLTDLAKRRGERAWVEPREVFFRSNCRRLREGYACPWGLENTDLRFLQGCESSRKLLFICSNTAIRWGAVFLTGEWTASMESQRRGEKWNCERTEDLLLVNAALLNVMVGGIEGKILRR
jgi:hypothetical protein